MATGANRPGVLRRLQSRRTQYPREDDSRLERLSSSAARDRYTGFRESVRSLLAAVEYGPMEDVTADAGASYRLPITGVRDVGDESRVQDVGSGHLLLSGAGLVRAVELDALVYGANRERESNLAFEVTGVGETSVSEPDWFGDVPETTTTDGGGEGGGGEGGDGGDGDSGTVETTETTTTTEQTPVQTIEGTDYDTKVVVGPDEELVFDPEVLRIEPGRPSGGCGSRTATTSNRRTSQRKEMERVHGDSQRRRGVPVHVRGGGGLRVHLSTPRRIGNEGRDRRRVVVEAPTDSNSATGAVRRSQRRARKGQFYPVLCYR